MLVPFTHRSLSSPPNRARGLAPHFVWGFLLIAPALVSGCWKNNVVIPDQTTAQEQFAFANQYYQQYMQPLTQNSQRKNQYARITLAAFQRVVDRFPEEKTLVGRSRLGIGLVWKTQGREGKALRILEKVIEDYPDDDFVQAYALFETGSLLDDLGKHTEAKKRYKEILDRYRGTQNPQLHTVVIQSRIKYQRVWEE